MLLAVFEERNFTAFLRYKKWDRKVDKNDLNFNKQYVKKKNKKKQTHLKKIQIRKCNKNIKIELDQY